VRARLARCRCSVMATAAIRRCRVETVVRLA
jgi:hypothetical protein